MKENVCCGLINFSFRSVRIRAEAVRPTVTSEPPASSFPLFECRAKTETLPSKIQFVCLSSVKEKVSFGSHHFHLGMRNLRISHNPAVWLVKREILDEAFDRLLGAFP